MVDKDESFEPIDWYHGCERTISKEVPNDPDPRWQHVPVTWSESSTIKVGDRYYDHLSGPDDNMGLWITSDEDAPRCGTRTFVKRQTVQVLMDKNRHGVASKRDLEEIADAFGPMELSPEECKKMLEAGGVYRTQEELVITDGFAETSEVPPIEETITDGFNAMTGLEKSLLREALLIEVAKSNPLYHNERGHECCVFCVGYPPHDPKCLIVRIRKATGEGST